MIDHLLPSLPRLPGPALLLSLPVRAIPRPLHSRALSAILNKILQEALQHRELDFLDGRILQIVISDLSLEYRLTLKGGRLAAARGQAMPDVHFGGQLKEFMLLALNREDPDTLFFQRRLQLEGDTELGLEIKNFLYTLDEDLLPLPVRRIAERLTALLD